MTRLATEGVVPVVRGSLSEEDAAAFRTYVTDLSDIPQESQTRIRFGFQKAYESAQLVREGLKDPMSR